MCVDLLDIDSRFNILLSPACTDGIACPNVVSKNSVSSPRFPFYSGLTVAF